MADKMEFPKTMREFIINHSFKDIAEVYTNGAELVPVFRVEQALEHYEKEIRNKVIEEFENKAIEWNYASTKKVPYEFVKWVAEKMKEGVKNA